MELWKPVNGFEKRFMISSYGQLLSLNGKYGGRKILSPYIDNCGYYSATLRMKPLKRKVRVHTLVAEHFVVKKNNNQKFVNHIDGNKLNNYDWNLEWCTPLENSQHAVKTGLVDFKGEKHHNSKLTKSDVLKMREMRFKNNTPYKEIAITFGVCVCQARDVVKGVNWGWLK